MKKKDASEWVHGKWNTYSNHKCRCEICTEAARVYQAAAHRRRMQENPDDVRRKQAERGKRYDQRHPERRRESSQRYRERHPEKVKEWNKSTSRAYWERKYGITKAEFLEEVDKRNGRCDICGNEDNRMLSLDHCHATNRNRGLLCRRCNMGLGCFGDDPAALRRAADYLEKD